MIDTREDQAAGLRRLFRRAPPTVVALYATGRNHLCTAAQAAYSIAGQAERVLILDEAEQRQSLAQLFDLPDGPDLLSVLGGKLDALELVQPVPGLLGRVPVNAAALALPLLDEQRRSQLVSALRHLNRHAGFVLIHSTPDSAADPSPFIFAAPRRLLVAEVSHSGFTDACKTIRHLAAAGAGSLHVALARARSRAEASAFFAGLNGIVRKQIGVPIAWLGEIERDDLAAGLAQDATEASPKGAEAAFLRRLEALAGGLRLAGVR